MSITSRLYCPADVPFTGKAERSRTGNPELRTIGIRRMTVEIKQAGAGMGRHTVKPLQPYEKASLTFTPEKGKWTDKADYQVVFLRDGQIVETNNFNISK